MVDRNAFRTNQVVIVGIVAIAFLIGMPWGGWLLGLLAASLALGVLAPGRGPIQFLYRAVLVPAGIVEPALEPGSVAPHRFAQGVGAAVLGAATLLLGIGYDALGWALGFVVLALALVNLVFGFCAGCYLYLQLGRQRRRTA